MGLNAASWGFQACSCVCFLPFSSVHIWRTEILSSLCVIAKCTIHVLQEPHMCVCVCVYIHFFFFLVNCFGSGFQLWDPWFKPTISGEPGEQEGCSD